MQERVYMLKASGAARRVTLSFLGVYVRESECEYVRVWFAKRQETNRQIPRTHSHIHTTNVLILRLLG